MSHWNDVPEVEPLPDTTWRRIERSVFTELDRNPAPRTAASPVHWSRRWRRPLLGTGVGLAAAAALLLVLRGLPGSSGPQPSRIVTDDAAVALTVGRAAIHVAPASTVWVHSNRGHEVMMVLEQGRVACTVAHDDNQPPLVVQAGDVRVEVVGTSFAVTRLGRSAMVEVDEGVVEVFHLGKRVRVSAGQRWAPAALGPVVGASTSTPGATTETTGEATPETTTETTTETTGEATPETTTAIASETGAQPGPDHAASEPAVAVPQRATRRRAPVAVGADGDDPKQRYEQAARLEASEPTAAIAIYRELARGKSAWAANALFAQARLELDRGRTREAVLLLRAYLRRYPGGNNAADARALLDSTARPAGLTR